MSDYAEYLAWKKDFRGPIHFSSWDQWINDWGYAVWQAARCNDTAPVAPIGDDALDELYLIAQDPPSLSEFREEARVIIDRAVLAAVAAQGNK